jgi:hypothetical protein
MLLFICFPKPSLTNRGEVKSSGPHHYPESYRDHNSCSCAKGIPQLNEPLHTILLDLI